MRMRAALLFGLLAGLWATPAAAQPPVPCNPTDTFWMDPILWQCKPSGIEWVNINDGVPGSPPTGVLTVDIDQATPGTTNGVVVNNIPHIVCDSGCGSPPATADGSAFTFGTTSVSPIGAVVDDVGTNAVPENSFGAPRMSGSRVLYMDLTKTGANATAIKVDPSAVTSPTTDRFTTTSASTTFTAGGQTLVLDVTGANSATLALSGTGTGSLSFEGSADGGATYFNWDGYNRNPGSSIFPVTAFWNIDNPSSAWAFPTQGVNRIRITANPFTAGSLVAVFTGSTQPFSPAPFLAPTYIGGPSGTNSSIAKVVNGALKTMLMYNNGSELGVTITPTDAQSAPAYSLETDSFPRMYNGATYDRMRGSIANGLSVDVTRVQGTLPLPTGAATAGKQDIGNLSLETVANNTNSLIDTGVNGVTITASGQVALAMFGISSGSADMRASVSVVVFNTSVFVGNLSFQITTNATDWVTAYCTDDDSRVHVTGTSGTGTFTCPVSGHGGFRVLSSGWVSGSAVLDIETSAAPFFDVAIADTMDNLLPTLVNGTQKAVVTNAGTFAVQATGTVTANAGSNLNTSALALDATLTGGTQKAITRGGAKGATTAADMTSTAEGADHQAADVQLYTGGAAIDPRSIRALTSTDVVTTAPPANASSNVAQVGGTTTDTNSGLKSAGTLRVVLATDQPALTNKLLVTPDSVALPANQSVNVAQFGGTNVVTGAGAGGAGIPRVTVSNDSNVIVTPPTLTKATQGATGFSTQDLKDAGRTAKSFYANNVAAGTTTTETLITLTQSSGTGATSSAASYTITNGKTFRITALSVASRGNATATVQSTVFNLRMNTAGACIVTSTPILFAAQSATPATASAWDRVIIPIPDGYEITGNGTIAICISAAATYVTTGPTWSVNLIGYEY